MRRILATGLAGALLMSGAVLGGCGKQSPEDSAGVQSAEEEMLSENEAPAEDSLPETDAIEPIDVTENTTKTVTITATGDCTLGKT
mgnify:FL=1